MPLRTSNTVERSVTCQPILPKVIPTNKSTLVLFPTKNMTVELASRYIQNVGASDCYYAFGHDCDLTNFNGILSKPANIDANGFGSGQQLDASNIGDALYVYSVGGTTIAISVFERDEMQQGGNILQQIP
jgi:hypothetical protein